MTIQNCRLTVDYDHYTPEPSSPGKPWTTLHLRVDKNTKPRMVDHWRWFIDACATDV
jgi:hypothetical protein